jgi:glycosyltransferase involved in cell wall biosynthesis
MLEVSIIMPCYNQSKYVQDAINSVINQTYANWELIIVNDGSTDNSKEVIEKHLKKIQCPQITFYSTENKGVSLARNYAIGKSVGRFILPLDADDKIANTFLEKTVPVLHANEQISIVYTDVEFFGSRKGKLNVKPFTLRNILLSNIIVCTALFRKSDFERTSGYDEAFRHGWEDWDFWLSILELKGSVQKISEVLFFYRIKENSRNASIDSNLDWQNEAKWKIFLKHKQLYNSVFGDPIRLINLMETKNDELKFMQKSPFRYLLNRNSLYRGLRKNKIV